MEAMGFVFHNGVEARIWQRHNILRPFVIKACLHAGGRRNRHLKRRPLPSARIVRSPSLDAIKHTLERSYKQWIALNASRSQLGVAPYQVHTSDG